MPWYVLRDLKRPNALYPAWRQLTDLSADFYTPMRDRLVVKGGKTIRQLRPVIPDLLFIHGTRQECDPIIHDIPTLQYRYQRGAAAGTPMTVADAEMDRFIRAVEAATGEVEYYLPGEITPRMYGRQVRIIGGPLHGYEGRLKSARGSKKRRLLVEIPGLLTAAIEVDPDLVEIINKK